jgi:hypothetical protein
MLHRNDDIEPIHLRLCPCGKQRPIERRANASFDSFSKKIELHSDPVRRAGTIRQRKSALLSCATCRSP